MKQIILFILKCATLYTLLSISFACGDDNEDGYPPIYWESQHLHNSYTIPDSLSDLNWNIDPYYHKDSFVIGYCIKGETVYSDECKIPNKPEVFDSICRLYHDTAWYGKSSETDPPVAYPVSGVSIVSDADFDESHPAGSDLSDITTVCTESWGEFVLNGYPRGDEQLIYLSKKFSEFTHNEKCLWWHGGKSFVIPLPTLSRTHHLTVTLSFEGGKSISSTIEVNL